MLYFSIVFAYLILKTIIHKNMSESAIVYIIALIITVVSMAVILPWIGKKIWTSPSPKLHLNLSYNNFMAQAQSVSLIITVLNEAITIELLLNAINRQKLLPTEVMIVDGGSTDKTVTKIEQFAADNKPNFCSRNKNLV